MVQGQPGPRSITTGGSDAAPQFWKERHFSAWTQTGLCQLASGPENSPMHVLFTRRDEVKCFQECSLRCWIGTWERGWDHSTWKKKNQKTTRIKVVIVFSKYEPVSSYGSAVHSFISRNPKRDQISYCLFLLLLFSCTIIIHLWPLSR